MLNVITLFSGYDSQCLALNRLGLPYDLAAWCEIDRHAITAHNALFPQWSGRNLGDVSRVDWAEWHSRHPQPIDLLTYSSPCQDFSSAGLQRGGEEGSGTRSGLLWETERAVRELRPRYLVFENVGGLVSDKFIDLFNRWQARLNGYGYTNFQQLMNAKDYGVPQNRLRIFMVSILDCPRAYYFPRPFPLTRRLKDVLEQNVEERYYLKDEQVAKLVSSIDKPIDDGKQEMLGWTRSSSGKGEPTYHPVNVANCVTVAKHENTQNYVTEPQIIDTTNMGFEGEVRIYDNYTPALKSGRAGILCTEPTIAAMRGRDKDNPNDRGKSTDNYAQRLEIKPDGTSNTLTSVAKDNLLIEPTIIDATNDFSEEEKRTYTEYTPALRSSLSGLMTTEGIRIRRLTERELYRLMDVSEPDIDTLLAAPIPRTHHAKLAGNSIVVACLYYIFRNLFVDTEPAAGTQTKLF